MGGDRDFKFGRQVDRSKSRIIYTICLHMNWKAHVACNFNHLSENEGILKVTASHVHYMLGNGTRESLILMKTTNSKRYMTYQYPLEANIPMTLSHLQGHSLLQAFRCDFYPRDATLARYWMS